MLLNWHANEDAGHIFNSITILRVPSPAGTHKTFHAQTALVGDLQRTFLPPPPLQVSALRFIYSPGRILHFNK